MLKNKQLLSQITLRKRNWRENTWKTFSFKSGFLFLDFPVWNWNVTHWSSFYYWVYFFRKNFWNSTSCSLIDFFLRKLKNFHLTLLLAMFHSNGGKLCFTPQKPVLEASFWFPVANNKNFWITFVISLAIS